jgi:hypothetical protein
MKKLVIEFNPDYNTVREVKDAAQILRDLIKRRELLRSRSLEREMPAEELARMFLDSFDTITQNVEVG